MITWSVLCSVSLTWTATPSVRERVILIRGWAALSPHDTTAQPCSIHHCFNWPTHHIMSPSANVMLSVQSSSVSRLIQTELAHRGISSQDSVDSCVVFSICQRGGGGGALSLYGYQTQSCVICGMTVLLDRVGVNEHVILTVQCDVSLSHSLYHFTKRWKQWASTNSSGRETLLR